MLKLTRFTLCLAAALCVASSAQAQMQWTVTGGGWTPFLPEYKGLFQTSNANVVEATDVFESDVSHYGGRARVHGFYDFVGYRTLLEVRATIAGADSMGDRASIDDPSAASQIYLSSLDGDNDLATLDGETVSTNLNADTFYHDSYIGLRDLFDLTDWGIGELTIGCGLSHMRFDQDLTMDATVSPTKGLVYQEDLESNFLGGEIVATIRRQLFGRDFFFDTSVGIYDLDVVYDGVSTTTDGGAVIDTGDVTSRLSSSAFTYEAAIRYDWHFAGALIRPTIGVKYITDMPSIVHANDLTTPVSLTTDDALLLEGGWEIVF
ncbi:MAG: hypothetical protein AAGD07_21820 [Planctomycetota bacterium]